MGWQKSQWSSGEGDSAQLVPGWINTDTGETTTTDPATLGQYIGQANGQELGLKGGLYLRDGKYYTNNGTTLTNVDPATLQNVVSGTDSARAQAVAHNQADGNFQAKLAGLAAAAIAGAGLNGLLSSEPVAAPVANSTAGLITPESASQLAANAQGMSIAPGTVTLNGALEAATGNAAQMSYIPGSLGSSGYALPLSSGLLTDAARIAAATLRPTVAAPPTAPSSIDKLTEWAKNNPMQAASMGLTAASLAGAASNKLSGANDTYTPPPIDQSIVNQYGHPTVGLLQSGGSPNYQDFATWGAPSGLLQMRLAKIKGLL